MYAGLSAEERGAPGRGKGMGFPARGHGFDVQRIANGYTGVWSDDRRQF